MSEARRTIFENHNPTRVMAAMQALNGVKGLKQADLCIIASQAVAHALGGLSPQERADAFPVIIEYAGEMLLTIDLENAAEHGAAAVGAVRPG